jgi:hypothetical protein
VTQCIFCHSSAYYSTVILLGKNQEVLLGSSLPIIVLFATIIKLGELFEVLRGDGLPPIVQQATEILPGYIDGHVR